MMVATVFEHLGSWTAKLHLADVPEEARHVACRAILDYVGVTLAAREGELAALLAAYRGGTPVGGDAATVIGQGASAPAESAAFINGATGHALDFDDSSEALAGHPTMVIFPAALAAAETVGASGADVVEGYIAGFEVAAKIGRAVNYTHYERGWHPTATLGVFGGTAAAARVLALDPEQTAVALSIAASVAAGIKANFGSMAKPLQAGRAAQNGLFAARLAQLGASANPSAFEAQQGFAAVHQGVDTVDMERLLAPVDEPWDLLETGVSVKRFPCCASTHGAIEAAFAVRERISTIDDVESVQVWTHPRRLQHTNRPQVSTGFQGKFSVQYTVATALRQGHIGLGDFTPEAVKRPEVAELMSRLDAQPMPEERWGRDHYPAEVEVTTRTGQSIRERIERPSGIGTGVPLTLDELTAKFLDCCQAGGVDRGTAEPLADQLLALDRNEELSDLLRLLAGG